MTTFPQLLLVLLLQSTMLLALGLLALHLTRRRGPAVQSLVGRASLVSAALLLLFLPLSGHVPPVFRVEPTPSQVTTLPEREGAEVKTQTVPANAAAPSDHAVPADTAASPDRAGNIPAPSGSPAPADIPALAAPIPQNGQARTEGQERGQGQARGPAPTPAALSKTPRLPAVPAAEALRAGAGGQALALRVASAVPGGFLLISAALLLWLGICQWHLTRLRRAAHAVTTGPAPALLTSLTPSPPRLLTHPSVHSPFLAGYVRPVIFLPPAFETDFSADALRAIFIHELAHRNRRDTHWTLAARLLTALLWPQPLLWLLVRKLEHISEDACDQAVLASACPPRAYAACLLSLAERPPLAGRQRPLSAGVAPFRSALARRITRILSIKGVSAMPAVTPRLRLTAAVLTLAAALSGAFLVSSAPAQVQAGASLPSQAPSAAPSIQSRTHIPASEVPARRAKYRPSNAEIIRYLETTLNSPAGDAASLSQARFLAGLTPVQGPGVVVTLTDSKKPLPSGLLAGMPPNIIHDSDINLVVNELKAAGAEAVAVNGQRLVATSAIRCVGPVVNVNNVPQAPPFVIKAIGNPKVLAAVLNIPGGMASIFKSFDPAMFSFRQAQMLTLPAYAGPDVPRYARPVRTGAAQASDAPGLQRGSGVVMTLTNSRKPFFAVALRGAAQPNLIHAAEVREAVSELNAAGAKAISINGQRIVAVGAIQQARTTILLDKMVINNVSRILINHTPQSSPYVIKAIGNPKKLTAALNKPRSLAARIKAFDPIMFSIQQSAMLTVPAYPGNRPNLYATPVRTGAAQAISVQQMTAKPAPSASTTQNQTIAGTHTVVGYGLIAWMRRKEFQCRAVKNSPASRLGVLTDRNYQVLAVNGQPVPQSAAQFAEIARSAPPLRLLLTTFGQPTHTVTFQKKDAYVTFTDAANAEGRAKEVQSAQAEAAKSKAVRGQIIQQLEDMIAIALPQAGDQTRAKALHLEERIGWSEDRLKFAEEYLAWCKKKHNVKSAAMPIALEANVRGYLKPDLAEEARLFPQTPETSSRLALMHGLSQQIGNMNMTVTDKQIQAEVITSITRERSPDMSL